jgi:CHASE2 domain-containing sensor protein
VNARTVVAIRVVVAVWLLGLTVVLFVYGRWGWAILTLVGMLANIAWLVYLLRRKGCGQQQ